MNKTNQTELDEAFDLINNQISCENKNIQLLVLNAGIDITKLTTEQLKELGLQKITSPTKSIYQNLLEKDIKNVSNNK